MNINLLNNLVELCARKGVTQAIICPGSRSAPLTIAFVRNKKIKCRTFSDERSAAFIALGIAQHTKHPVVLICTSGSAAFNFAPAIAEAFFQQIPLIVFTADRPEEWIDQLDGQTIRQRDLYGNHVKKYFELPHEGSHPDIEWHSNRIINEAINLTTSGNCGPVHINAPFREPLYPTAPAAENVNLKDIRVIEEVFTRSTADDAEISALASYASGLKRVLIVAGQDQPDNDLISAVADITEYYHWPIAGDILSNLHSLKYFCGHTDTFLGQLPDNRKERLQPDLLITFGKSLISKNLKLFLRKYKPREHWHIQESGDVADTFQSLTRIIRVSPAQLLKRLVQRQIDVNPFWQEYKNYWVAEDARAKETISHFFGRKTEGEFHFVKKVIESLPPNSNLHLANSMTVRYANHIGLQESQKDITVFSNRGTSGIDGCSSTAVGHALASGKVNILITGDLAFFYDRNAFWHNYQLPNLFIIVLNNHGGIIFNLIDGPSGLPESNEFFITEQRLNAKALASEFGLSYSNGTGSMENFFVSDRSIKIMEFESSQSTNKIIFEEFKKEITKSL